MMEPALDSTVCGGFRRVRTPLRGVALAMALLGGSCTSLVEAGEVKTTTFLIPQVGISYTAFLPPGDPRVGRPVIETRVYLNVEAFPGSNAANFTTDLGLPIDPLPGNSNVFFANGADLGWSGVGVFTHFESTQEYNGTFISRLFGAETPSENFAGRVLECTRIEVDYIAGPTFPPADMNCDSVISVGDIGPFVLALTDPDGYAAQFPACNIDNGDINSDGAVTVGDIGGFVELLLG